MTPTETGWLYPEYRALGHAMARKNTKPWLLTGGYRNCVVPTSKSSIAKDVARRLVKRRNFSEGMHRLNVSIDTPVLCGSLPSVVAQLYLWKLGWLHQFTKRSVESEPLEDLIVAYDGVRADLGAVYADGAILVYSNSGLSDEMGRALHRLLHAACLTARN